MAALTRTKTLFINPDRLYDLLHEQKNNSGGIDSILEKAARLQGLTLEESARLLAVSSEEETQKIFTAAGKVKEKIYGRRIVLFAPLYIGNICANDCLYCAFRAPNKSLARRRLTLDEIELETRALLREGHKRLLMLAGEEEQSGIDAITAAIERVYSIKEPSPVNGKPQSIRRINAEFAPMSVDDFRRLKAAKIGTYACFQETYDPDVYEASHPRGPKADYEWRLSVMDRAMEAGIEDVGIGALFGLADYRFEVLALLSHARHLEERFGCGCHTISVPRIEPALGAPLSESIPHPVSDMDFMKLVAVLRLSLPYTGIILSTREQESLRNKLFRFGVSQISAGSRTNPGAYAEGSGEHSAEQFQLGDHRSLKEVLYALSEMGYVPSFCTGCYRKGRVGKDFMDLAKPGLIQHFCEPNAFFTFMEYINDFCKDSEQQRFMELAHSMASAYPRGISDKIREGFKKIEGGERDVYL